MKTAWIPIALLAAGCASNAQLHTPAPAPSTAPTTGVATDDQTEQTPAPAPTEEPSDAPITSRDIPTDCAAPGDICAPPRKFVKRLCKKTTPDLALTMFAKKSPWTRAYVRQDMEAWYAKARRTQPRSLRYAEEVIIVANRTNDDNGGIQISGQGSYDIYRWDGTCVSVMAGEVGFYRPSHPDVATIRWKRLDDDVKDVLEKNQKIAFRNTRRRKVCKRLGDGSANRCERAKLELSRMIAEYVRKGGDVPQPNLIP